MFHPENALPIPSWYDDPRDRELNKLIPILERLSQVDDVRNYIRYLVIDNRILFTRA
jgi:RNA polymerase II subunit A small phosphatase-like protein